MTMANPYDFYPREGMVQPAIENATKLLGIREHSRLGDAELAMRGRVADQTADYHNRHLDIQNQQLDINRQTNARQERQQAPRNQNFGAHNFLKVRGEFNKLGIDPDKVPFLMQAKQYAMDPTVNTGRVADETVQNWEKVKQETSEELLNQAIKKQEKDPTFDIKKVTSYIDHLNSLDTPEKVYQSLFPNVYRQDKIDQENSKAALLALKPQPNPRPSVDLGNAVRIFDNEGNYQDVPKGVSPTAAAGQGKAPSGYRYTANGDLEPIPNGPADTKYQAKYAQDLGRVENLTDSSSRLAEDARKLAKHPGLPRITGVMGYAPNIKGSDASNAQAALDSLKAQSAFTTLQNMREMSKTGGALGQVSDMENKMLQAALASLDTAQSEKQIKEALEKIAQISERASKRVKDSFDRQYSRSRGSVSVEPGVATKITAPGGKKPLSEY